jgi:ParB family chromosome partitioning protein
MGIHDKFGASSQSMKLDGTHATKRTVIPGIQTGELSEQRDAAIDRAELAEAEVKKLQSKLEEAKEQGSAMQIPLDQLVEAPGRRRNLSPDAFAELKANLKQHALVTPITVRPLPNGKYEIVSGHNRTAAYRELGKDAIAAWPAQTDDSQVEELAFYANLLQPDLSAFEKYRGLKKIQEQNPDLNHEGLADRIGMSRTLVTELLSFDSLPPQALTALDSRPGALGSKVLIQLAALAKEGRIDSVVTAIQAAVTQGKGAAEVLQIAAGERRPQPEKIEPIRIKAGRKNYCSMSSAKNVVRIQFQNESDRIEIESEIQALLENIAARKKS